MWNSTVLNHDEDLSTHGSQSSIFQRSLEIWKEQEIWLIPSYNADPRKQDHDTPAIHLMPALKADIVNQSHTLSIRGQIYLLNFNF